MTTPTERRYLLREGQLLGWMLGPIAYGISPWLWSAWCVVLLAVWVSSLFKATWPRSEPEVTK